MPFISIILLGLAVSCDGFGAGFAYGVRRLHIPLTSIVIICLSSSLSVFISMKVGSFMATLFSLRIASLIGGLILFAVGAAIVYQSLQNWMAPVKETEIKEKKSGKGFTVVHSVMREPELADFDRSGAISGKEAVILGVALALDAFAAGFGAAMMGFAPGFTSLTVGITKFFLLTAGLFLGRKYSRHLAGYKAAVLSGAVLMLLGIVNLLP